MASTILYGTATFDSGTPMKILVIEDSLFLRFAIEKVLHKGGHEVTSVADGRAGLSAARTALPELILLDMMLPSLDGTSVLKELKQDPSTSRIPVIVLSSLPQKNEERLKKAGASAYVAKSELNFDKNADLLLAVVEKTTRN